jgi:putative oxidoreductase
MQNQKWTRMLCCSILHLSPPTSQKELDFNPPSLAGFFRLLPLIVPDNETNHRWITGLSCSANGLKCFDLLGFGQRHPFNFQEFFMSKAIQVLDSADGGKLVLRATLAVVILFHGIAKLGGGVDFVTGLLAQAGLPPVLGYLVVVGEVVAPLMVLLGLWARAGAVIIAVNMVVALLLVHTGDFLKLNATGGWAIELQVLLLANAAAVALLGAGRYSIQGARSGWN